MPEPLYTEYDIMVLWQAHAANLADARAGMDPLAFRSLVKHRAEEALKTIPRAVEYRRQMAAMVAGALPEVWNAVHQAMKNQELVQVFYQPSSHGYIGYVVEIKAKGFSILNDSDSTAYDFDWPMVTEVTFTQPQLWDGDQA